MLRPLPPLQRVHSAVHSVRLPGHSVRGAAAAAPPPPRCLLLSPPPDPAAACPPCPPPAPQFIRQEDSKSQASLDYKLEAQ